MEPVVAITITVPSAVTPQTIWSVIGPKVIMAVAFVTLILPGIAEFYINLRTRNAQYPTQRIRVLLRHTRRPPYALSPFWPHSHHRHGDGVAYPRQPAMG